MKIKRFDQYIKESYLFGSRAPLSHSTNVWYAKDIFDTNVIKKQDTGTASVVSLTRDPNFTYMNLPVTIVMDAEKLSANYKIVPFDYMHFEPHTKADPTRKGDFEYEETVNKDITNLNRYITEIRLNASIEKFRNAPMNTREEWRESYEDLLHSIIEYKENNKAVKILFKGKEVDDKFLKGELNISEGIYSKMSGTRMFVSKAADDNDFKVYYSTYEPIVGKDKDSFSKFLKQNGIAHTKAGGNAMKMDKANVEKLKKSMLNLKESLKNEKPLTKAEINKIKYFYHATPYNNLGKIMSEGIKPGPEGIVYLADTFENAAKFLILRGAPMVVFKIDSSKLDKNKIEESFDHSYDFFRCHAFLYQGQISKEAIDYNDIMKY